ncbi:MAG: acetylglutamate kinase [Phycisphaeraceae bacterium]|nr:acetylglutamate kinase [Phycisphaeraceae bacterium]
MNVAIDKAEALVEAHRYIRRFRDKIVVVKVGGSIQEDPAQMRDLMEDVAFMSAVGMRPIVVHGGGKSITHAMSKAGLQARFIQGRRYTDRRTLEIAEDILVNEVNRSLVQYLNDSGARAIGLHSQGSCVLFAERMYLKGERGEAVDLGYVGNVVDVNTVLLDAVCEDGYIPVIAPIAVVRGRMRHDGTPVSQNGTANAAAAMGAAPESEGVWKLNVNADTAAGHVAASMRAEKLVVCSDTHGIRTDPADANSYASCLTRAEIDELIKRGVIGEGMLPKVEACLVALAGGVSKTHIIDGRVPHSLLLEIYTDAGIGTEIDPD